VIGGLFCATIATLIFVPSVFALLHGTRKDEDVNVERARQDAEAHA